MLTPRDFENYRNLLHTEIANRQALGGYSPEAGTILMLCRLSFDLLQHLEEAQERAAPVKREPVKRRKK